LEFIKVWIKRSLTGSASAAKSWEAASICPWVIKEWLPNEELLDASFITTLTYSTISLI
jgi:hypothetical protein